MMDDARFGVASQPRQQAICRFSPERVQMHAHRRQWGPGM